MSDEATDVIHDAVIEIMEILSAVRMTFPGDRSITATVVSEVVALWLLDFPEDKREQIMATLDFAVKMVNEQFAMKEAKA